MRAGLLLASFVLVALSEPSHGTRDLVRTTGNVPHLTAPVKLPPIPQGGSPDLPISAPPLARNVTGFQPEGVHLTQWTTSSVLVSWQTGADLIGDNYSPPAPYDPTTVHSTVKWGTGSGQLTQTATGDDNRLVYSYIYGQDAGDTTYHSPILHHVLLTGLQPGTPHFYSVGDAAHGLSQEFGFTTLPDRYPLRIGIVGDLGETANSTQTIDHLIGNNPDVVMLVGDFSYADDHISGDKRGPAQFTGTPISEQPRWDGWARMTQPLLSRLPLISTRGNHEVEPLLAAHNATLTAANARYPYPQDPAAATLMTGPNIGAYFLDQGNPTSQFKNESGFEAQSGYYSLDLPRVHIISLNSYLPWGTASQQYKWLLEDLAKVDRAKTPWLIVIFHTPVYHNYAGHFKEGDTFLAIYEDIFYNHRVDLVYSGHVHAYERSHPVYQYQRDDCGPMYTTIGDGGNVEGLYRTYIDAQPQQEFCSNPALYQLPSYQPIPFAQPITSLQDGRFCPSQQPSWSAYREPTFGHGILELVNATHAVWEWHRNYDEGPVVADRVVVSKKAACGNSRRLFGMLSAA